ncbi:MAG: DNA cytosine methyltransferase [Bacilli bacterium]|nr:DNA cytosine methyltransferase [Bacilli bacterium]
METKTKLFNFIDLFAGIGGFRYALEANGGNCVFSSEWDAYCQESYQLNFNEKPYGDITKISEKDIPPHDVLCAGFPCQPFSISGKQKGFEDTRGTLFFDIARIVKYHKPKIIFLENVKNLNSHNGGATFKVIKETLNKLGYKVFHQVLNAKNFGLPQNRERIAIVCIRKDIVKKDFKFPPSKQKLITISDIKENEEKTNKYIIKRDDIKIDEKKLESAINNGKVARPLQIGVIANGGQGNRIYHENGIGITLAASSGGAAPKTGAYYIDGVVRRLSPREAARLQGFPEDFIIIKNESQALKQFGNSVPINLLNAVMEEINLITEWE